MSIEINQPTRNRLNSINNLVRFTFKNEVKYIINAAGKILISNCKNLNLGFEENTNLLQQLRTYFKVLTDPYLQELAIQEKSFQGEFKLLNEDRWFRLLLGTIDEQKETLFLVQLQEITQQKIIAQQLVRQKRNVENEMLMRTQEFILTDQAMSNDGGFLTNFLRGLRHDLISPVTQLKELLKFYTAAKNIDKKKKAQGMMSDSLEKLTRTTKGFSDFVDLYFLPQKAQKQITFEKAFMESSEMLERKITESNATINTDFSQSNNTQFSSSPLISIFYNLLSNSLKFRKIDTELIINIEAKVVHSTVELCFKDNGIGMDLAAYGDNLFKPFKRNNLTQPGAGMSLSLIHKILTKDNQGSIKINSRPNQGCEVTLTFFNLS